MSFASPSSPPSPSSGTPLMYNTLLHLQQGKTLLHLRNKLCAIRVAVAVSLYTLESRYAEVVGQAANHAHRISTSPRFPVNCPSMNSSVFANCRFMYASTDTRYPAATQRAYAEHYPWSDMTGLASGYLCIPCPTSASQPQLYPSTR